MGASLILVEIPSCRLSCRVCKDTLSECAVQDREPSEEDSPRWGKARASCLSKSSPTCRKRPTLTRKSCNNGIKASSRTVQVACSPRPSSKKSTNNSSLLATRPPSPTTSLTSSTPTNPAASTSKSSSARCRRREDQLRRDAGDCRGHLQDGGLDGKTARGRGHAGEAREEDLSHDG